ncbi:MAG: hypothetical protein JMN24_14430 [gamma proteobacterium endosymbiont of Lamellibrachia anaximandri]|nr:hypothetical protein [gamma proteobacterium endosymbiont of Lamellibrachia anaximandri]
MDVDNDNYYRHHGYYRHDGGGFGAGLFTGLVIGAAIASIPPTHTTVIVGTTPYYYADGIYYQTVPAGGYVVVSAPVGAAVAVVPPNSAQITLGDTVYFYHDGTYYVQHDTVFQVVAAPIGITVPTTPTGATSKTINSQTYFEFQKVYYQPVIIGGTTSYMTVKIH